ncbi:DMT family transporter [Lihuaxuella thermophila]|uniref:Threonine/homoserine efflux transporter RhtA n=1 Tax=Lihuaxuella thermophila TaxID=1173111 RepID=A0A1H8FTQ7_9BACL|nr:DMT family transporter [Lihuaxuella thermophila]SEN35062.1 Threonine/homoserine efflux transporter RhtA [Lihuaxuella thermophila]
MFESRKWLADIILIGIAFVWGTTFVMVQEAISTLLPFSFLTIRFGLAALFLCLFFRLSMRQKGPLSAEARRQNRIGGFVLGLFLFLGYAFQTFSLLYTTSGKSGFLTGVSVALVPVLSFLILGIRVRFVSVLGVLLAVSGLYLLAFADFSVINRGDVLAFFCAIFFGLQIVFTAKFSGTRSVFHLVTIQMVTVTILSLCSAILFEPWHLMLKPDTYLNPAVASALLVTSLFATALAFIGQTHVQKFTTPNRVALIFSMEPVFAALADYWWQGVALGGRALAGAFLILCGMILAEVHFPTLSIFRKKVKEKSGQ